MTSQRTFITELKQVFLEMICIPFQGFHLLKLNAVTNTGLEDCFCHEVIKGPVVWRLDNAVYQVNHYPVDNMVCFVNTYPLDKQFTQWKALFSRWTTRARWIASKVHVAGRDLEVDNDFCHLSFAFISKVPEFLLKWQLINLIKL